MLGFFMASRPACNVTRHQQTPALAPGVFVGMVAGERGVLLSHYKERAVTIYQELQDEIRKWDEAVDEQSEQLVFAANLMASKFGEYLGAEGAAVVRIGVGRGDSFQARNLVVVDCEPDGIGQLDYTLRFKVLPTDDPAYEWTYDVRIRLSIVDHAFDFTIMADNGSTKDYEFITRDAALNGAFAPIYQAIVQVFKDDFDAGRVRRLG